MNTAPNPERRAKLETAKKERGKRPLLEPVTWLFARAPLRRFTFFADLDWRLLPPLVLDQCKLYTKKAGMPWAFVTWAHVNDGVDHWLSSTSPVIVPHEWHSGKQRSLIDVVAPSGGGQKGCDADVERSLAGPERQRVARRHRWPAAAEGDAHPWLN
jgi:cytolysin-activating lysine-acyltransferase